MARKGGVPAKRVLNCLTLAQLVQHLQKRKKRSRVPSDFSDLNEDNPHAHDRRREENRGEGHRLGAPVPR
jgi:hypothetical protein